MDLRPAWFRANTAILRYLLVFVGAVSSPILGLNNLTLGAQMVVSLTCFLPGLVSLVAAVCELLGDGWRDGGGQSIYWLVSGVSDCVLGVVFFLREDKFMLLPPLHWIVNTVTYNLYNFLQLSLTPFYVPDFGSSFLLVLWAGFMCFRYWVLRQSLADIAHDR